MTILPQLERDLFHAADQRLGRGAPELRQPPGSRASTFGAHARRAAASLPLILSAASAVAIVIVALVLLRPGHQSTENPSTPTGLLGGSSRAALLRTFGVLRRAQTNADLDRGLLGLYLESLGPRSGTIPHERYIPVSGPVLARKRGGYPKLDRRLARVVNIPAWSVKVLIAPTTFQPSPSSPRRSEGLNLALRIGTARTIPPSSLSGTGPQPASVGTVLAHGLAIADLVRGTDLMDAAVAVPDGVASIRLGPFAIARHATPFGVSTKALSAALAAVHGSATVHDNIGAFQLVIPVVTSHRTPAGPPGAQRGFVLFGMPTTAQAAWVDARGHIVKRTTTSIDLFVRVQSKRAR
jgi:hypothetical protein